MLKKFILIEDYDHAGIKFTAKQNKIRCILHFLPAFIVIFLASITHYVIGYSAAIIWAVYVVNLELIGFGMKAGKPQCSWQSPLKTRSDLITKLGALLGLIGIF
jgi:hypothetical protein